jgi:transcriptional regulator GlxA family with amidase domain
MTSVAILLFDGVEVLDFAAPFEVLSLAGTRIQPGSLQVWTVGPQERVTARNGLEVCPSQVLSPTTPWPDVLVLPGGPGTEPLIDGAPAVMEWIGQAVPRASWTMSICSGALMLAQGGFLRNRRATTHHSDLDVLVKREPTVLPQPGRRFVRDGTFITSAGISAGLDSSLFLVARLLGEPVARQTAHWLEYTSDGWLEN